MKFFLCLWLIVACPTPGDSRRAFTPHPTLERYANPLQTHRNFGLAKCIAECQRAKLCQSVSYQQTTRDCDIYTVHPSQTSVPGIADPGWTVYYTTDEDIMAEAEAWQSSTAIDDDGFSYNASLAIDGNTNGNFSMRSCSSTNTSDFAVPFWVVKLPFPILIHRLTIYYRTDCCHDRFYHIYVSVADNKDFHGETVYDSYTGPPDSVWPLTITCAPIVYGQYIKMTHNNFENIQLCEVAVHPY